MHDANRDRSTFGCGDLGRGDCGLQFTHPSLPMLRQIDSARRVDGNPVTQVDGCVDVNGALLQGE
jgi:hypothetical protein